MPGTCANSTLATSVVPCDGANPEGLGSDQRCSTNLYDNQGYLTLDFPCSSAKTCTGDGQCPLVC